MLVFIVVVVVHAVAVDSDGRGSIKYVNQCV